MKGLDHITPIEQHLIDFVKDLRQNKGLTQEDIANIIGLAREFVKNAENIHSRAKYNINHINALADYFNLSPKEFFPDKALPLEFSAKEAADKEKKAKAIGKKGRPAKASSVIARGKKKS